MKKIFTLTKYVLILIACISIHSTFVNAAGSSISTISSSVYTVTDDGSGTGVIYNVPFGTTTAEFLSNITKDQPDETIDDSGLFVSETIVPGDSSIIVISQDSSSSTFYSFDSGPDATSISISGNAVVGQTLTGSYVYSDLESNPEGASTFKWYRGGNNNISVISGQVSTTYVVQPEDEGKVLYFEVTPIASAGTTVKRPFKSFGVLIDNGPVASSVSISGNPVLGQTLTGSYTYTNKTYQLENVGTPHFSTGTAAYTAFDIGPDGIPYVVYPDTGNTGNGVVQKFNGSSWVKVGSDFSDGTILGYPFISIDQNSVPYVSYADTTHGNKITVRKFNGSSWVDVGSPSFSAGSVGFYSPVSFGPSGTPYVAYRDSTHSGKIVVKKISGSDWVDVGTPYFSDGLAISISLAVDSNNVPYVTYGDSAHDQLVVVKKFNGSDWENVGPSYLADANPASSRAIAFDHSNTPYLASIGPAYIQGKAVVRKFNGSSWVVVGSEYFSDGEANHLMIDFDSNGIPYVGYEDYPNGRYGADWLTESRLFVKKFDGTDWVNMITPTITSNGSDIIFFALGADDVPYFGYDGGVGIGDPDNWKALAQKSISSDQSEGVSAFKWYRNNHVIDGATSPTYVVTSADLGESIRFEVTPVASAGTTQGAAVTSNAVRIPSPSSGGLIGGYRPNHSQSNSLNGSSISVSQGAISKRVLKYRMKGVDVKDMQVYLNNHGFVISQKGVGALGKETDYFGMKTKLAVISFQKAHNLKADGVVGPKTWAEMN